MMKRMIAVLIAFAVGCSLYAAGELDNAVLHGETDKERAIDYAPGEEMVFTIAPQGIDGAIPEGEYFLDWKRTDDFGGIEKGRIPFYLRQRLNCHRIL